MQDYFGKNVLSNAGFETGTFSPWVLTDVAGSQVQNVDKKAGTYAAELKVNNVADTQLYQGIFNCQGEQNIPIAFWAKHPGGALVAKVEIVVYDSDGSFITHYPHTFTNGGAGWIEQSWHYRLPRYATKFGINFRVSIPAGLGSLFLDSIYIPAIPRVIIDEEGREAGSDNYYWQNQVGTAMTNAFAQQIFCFFTKKILLSNDSATNWIEFSWAGAAADGRLLPGETLSFSNLRRNRIYLRGQAGGEDYRIMAT